MSQRIRLATNNPMALNQYAYPQPTGLQQLGDTLLRSSGDYANIQLQRQAEDRRRMQQLADVQSQRSYTSGEQNRLHQQRIDDETYQLLLKEGWLKPNDAQNPTAVAAAADKRQKHIDELMTRDAAQRQNAVTAAARVAQQRDEVRRKMNALDSVLSQPEPEPNPNEVTKEAIRMASQGLKPGEQPSTEAIQQAWKPAYDAVNTRMNGAWFRQKSDALIQRQCHVDVARINRRIDRCGRGRGVEDAISRLIMLICDHVRVCFGGYGGSCDCGRRIQPDEIR